jgi:uncharacterized protein YecE (DUF72 family)
MSSGRIRVGIGGWNFEDWRGPFYPKGTRQKDELAYATSKVTAIEINATYYGSQSPKSFANWGSTAPDGFQYSVKASRFCTNRKNLAEAKDSITRFLGQGISELRDRMGPILWQFPETKKFDAADIAEFFKLLPSELDGLPLRHALELRHDSFKDAAFIDVARGANAAIVRAYSPEFPLIEADTADFVYARVMLAEEGKPEGYNPGELDQWAETARKWAADGKDVYLFFIAAAKVRNPAAAMALIQRLG